MEGQKLTQRATKVKREMLASQSSDLMFVEILTEIVEVTNLPVTHKGNLVLCISKKHPGIMFGENRMISICTNAEETQVVVIHCEPEGELLFKLFSDSDSDISFGTTSISLADLLKSVSELTILKRLKFGSGTEPVMLNVAISTTPPSPVPYYALPMVDINAYTEEIDGSTKHKNGDIFTWASSVLALATCSASCKDGGSGGYGAKCHGGGGMSMYASSVLGSGGCSAKSHGGGGGGSCGAKCHGGGGFSMCSVLVSGGCGAKCHGGGGGGGSCGAKCHGGGTCHG